MISLYDVSVHVHVCAQSDTCPDRYAHSRADVYAHSCPDAYAHSCADVHVSACCSC
jgi:hypothetical protein